MLKRGLEAPSWIWETACWRDDITGLLGATVLPYEHERPSIETAIWLTLPRYR